MHPSEILSRIKTNFLLNFETQFLLKVNKNRNDFMKTQFGPKSKVIIVRISALLEGVSKISRLAIQVRTCIASLLIFETPSSRAEILTIITLLFGPNCVFIKSFRFLLTFSRNWVSKLSKKFVLILDKISLGCICLFSNKHLVKKSVLSVTQACACF